MNEFDREDEIELIDILRVIWRWKYFIIGGTVLCMIAAALVSSLMAKTYRISMVLEPGILKLKENGDHVSVDSPENLKALIEFGAFNEKIIKNINSSDNRDLLRSLRFKVSIPKNSETLKILYETPNIELGKRVLNLLQVLLLNKYAELVAYSKNEYDKQITFKRTEMADVEAEVQSKKKQIANLQDRINELRLKVESIKNNSQALMQERNKFLSEKRDEDGILSVLLYTNTIQQNLQVEDRYMEELHDYLSKVENLQLEINKLNSNLTALVEGIKDLKYKKQKILNIQVVQKPRKEPIPVSPRKRLNILLAAVIGLFFMSFLAFFLEYINKHKPNKESQTDNHL
jgi:uncharacterized protein involved in exopolysaccharide biosynthesis